MGKFIKTNFILILSIIYVLSPIDIIPEALLGPIGIIDDAGVVLLMGGQLIWKYIQQSKVDAALAKVDDKN